MVQRKKPVIQEQVQHVPKARADRFGSPSSGEVMVQQVPVQKVVEKQVGSWEVFMCLVRCMCLKSSTSMRWSMSL